MSVGVMTDVPPESKAIIIATSFACPGCPGKAHESCLVNGKVTVQLHAARKAVYDMALHQLKQFRGLWVPPYERDKFRELREQQRAEGGPRTVSLYTRVPSKYRVLDAETGQVWKWGKTPLGEEGWVSADKV